MSMITEQIKRLREAADFRHTIGDYMTAGLHREAANTIEQLAAKVRAENNVSQPCEDAISRQAVLDIVNNPLNIRLDEIIKKLPSVKSTD